MPTEDGIYYLADDRKYGEDWFTALAKVEADPTTGDALKDMRNTVVKEVGGDPKSTLLHGAFDRHARGFIRIEFIRLMVEAERAGLVVPKENQQAVYIKLTESIYRGLLSSLVYAVDSHDYMSTKTWEAKLYSLFDEVLDGDMFTTGNPMLQSVDWESLRSILERMVEDFAERIASLW